MIVHELKAKSYNVTHIDTECLFMYFLGLHTGNSSNDSKHRHLEHILM